MNTWVRHSLEAGAVTAGAVMEGSAAYAGTTAISADNLCGIAASIDGLYDAKMISAGDAGVLNGNQVFLPIRAPISLRGVTASVLGKADAGCEDGASATLGGHTGDCGCGGQDGLHPYSRHDTTESLPKAEVLGGLPVVGQRTQGGPPAVDRLHGLTGT